jgi:hypothetical protein
MQLTRPVVATDPRLFGRRADRRPLTGEGMSRSDDLRLFASTFAAGFLFVSILIA